MMGGVMWSWGARAVSPSRPHCCKSIRVTVSYSPDMENSLVGGTAWGQRPETIRGISVSSSVL